MATALKAGIPVEFRCSSCRSATAPPTRRLHNRRKNAAPAAAAEGAAGGAAGAAADSGHVGRATVEWAAEAAADDPAADTGHVGGVRPYHKKVTRDFDSDDEAFDILEADLFKSVMFSKVLLPLPIGDLDESEILPEFPSPLPFSIALLALTPQPLLNRSLLNRLPPLLPVARKQSMYLEWYLELVI